MKIEFKKVCDLIKNIADNDTKTLLMNMVAEIEEAVNFANEVEAGTNLEIMADIAERAIKDSDTIKQLINKAVDNSRRQEAFFDANSLPQNIRNQFRQCYVNNALSGAKKEVMIDDLNKILVENSISGISIPEIIESGFQSTWEINNELYNALGFGIPTAWYYTPQEMLEAEIVAHGWKPIDSETKKRLEKLEQNINLLKKTIDPDYIYKRQTFERKDVTNLMQRGDWGVWIAQIYAELHSQIINTILGVILGADVPKNSQDGSINFEPIPNADDIFTFKRMAASENPSLEECRQLCDLVKDTMNQGKWFVANTKTITNISKILTAAGATPQYLSKEALAGQLGVSMVYTTDLCPAPICFVPKGYAVKQMEVIELPFWEYKQNQYNVIVERMEAGAVKAINSAAVLQKFIQPVAPTSITVAPASAAAGTERTITVAGGAGGVIAIYTDAAATTLVGKLKGVTDSLKVTPTVTTTYYARWESGSTVSSTKSAVATVTE
jgi:hypothetical protein